MKKVLSILGVIGLLSITALNTVCCGQMYTEDAEDKESDRINEAPYDVQGNLILTPTE